MCVLVLQAITVKVMLSKLPCASFTKFIIVVTEHIVSMDFYILGVSKIKFCHLLLFGKSKGKPSTFCLITFKTCKD